MSLRLKFQQIPVKIFFIFINFLAIEKALPSSIPLVLEKKDSTGLDFVVLLRPKKIDIRGYLNYTDEEDNCPFSKLQNSHVELINLDDPNTNEEEKTVIKNINNACQFVFRNIENKRFSLKIFEKQGKMSPNTKLVFEQILDLSNDPEIKNGIRIVKADILNQKKNLVDGLSYSIYSPIFLIFMVISFLKFEWAVKIVNYSMAAPFIFMSNLLKLGRRRK